MSDMLNSLSKLGLPSARLMTYIHWYNGVKSAKTPGVFYLKRGPYDPVPSAPWTRSDRYENEEGYEATMLRMALIAERRRPFKMVDKRRVFSEKYEGEGQIYTELLGVAEGIPGVTVFASDGMTGQEVGRMLTTFLYDVVKPAKYMTGLEVPPWSFWFTVTSQRGPDGKYAYADTGHGATVTLPALELPQSLTESQLSRLYTGQDIVQYGFEIEAQYDYFKPLRPWLYPYTPVEIDDTPQTDAAPAQPQPTQPALTERMIDVDMINAIRDLQRELKLSEARISETLSKDYAASKLEQLTRIQGDELHKRLKKARDERIAAANANKVKQGGNYARSN